MLVSKQNTHVSLKAFFEVSFCMLLLSIRNFIFLKNEAVELGFGFWRRISAGSCTVWQNGFWAQAALEQQSGSKQSLSPSTTKQQRPQVMKNKCSCSTISFIIFHYYLLFSFISLCINLLSLFCKDLYKIKDTNKHYSHFYIFILSVLKF